jgi:hypothetical protein
MIEIDDTNIESYLEEQLIRKCRVLPRNLGDVMKILKIIHENPGIPTNDLAVASEKPNATFYRTLKWLRDHKVITTNNRVNFPVSKRQFLIPNSIRQGNLPSAEHAPITHLVAYLTKFNDKDLIPPYHLTRDQIIQKVKKQIEETPTKAYQLVTGLIEGLAAYAILQEDISSFTNMIGKLEPPQNLDQL